MPKVAQTDLEAFGRAVREARVLRGWSLDDLAETALGNRNSKGFLSKVENGRRQVSPLTAGKIVTELKLPTHHLAPFLASGTPVDEVTIEDRNAEHLLNIATRNPTTFQPAEALLIALAYTYAPGSEADLVSASNGLRAALDTAAEMQRTARLPHNAADQVDAVLAELDALNAKGDLDAGAATLATARAAARDRIAEETSGLMRLLDSTVTQSRLRNAPQEAADALVEKLLLDAPLDIFATLRIAQNEWYERGRDYGTTFDASVAIHLADKLLTFAQSPYQLGLALNDLGIALATRGGHNTDTSRLNSALEAFTAALRYRTRETAPLDWAMTQMNVGNTLIMLYEREPAPVRLGQAILAYMEALKEQTKESVPLDWALTQSNLGNALKAKGEHENDTERLRAAVVAYGQALQEFTYERTPFKWAMVQNNLGSALLAIGRREPDGAQLAASMAAYVTALKVYDCESMPKFWAQTQMNLAKVRNALFDKTGDGIHLLHARNLAVAAREIFVAAHADYDVHSANNVLADIAAREAP